MLIANDHKDNIFICPGFDSRSRHYDLRDKLCPASKTQYGLNIAKNRRKSSKQPTYQRKSDVIEANVMQRSANNTTHWSTYSN